MLIIEVVNIASSKSGQKKKKVGLECCINHKDPETYAKTTYDVPRLQQNYFIQHLHTVKLATRLGKLSITKALAGFCWWVLISQLLYCLCTHCCAVSPPDSLLFVFTSHTYYPLFSPHFLLSVLGLSVLHLSVGRAIKRMNYAR